MALLTIAEARTHITTSLVDAALQRLLDASEADIVAAIGAVGNVTEMFTAGPGDLIALSRRASAVVSVNERDTVLNANDYELIGSGRFLRRKEAGANPDTRWRGRIYVVYTPVSDLARRKMAQVALITIYMDTQEGGATTSERIGEWSETFSTSVEAQAKRSDVLASLTNRFVLA